MTLQAMASRPDAAWLDQVRRLASAPEPEARVGAARLLAAHDPDLARKLLESAMNDPNPAIREMASEGLSGTGVTDLSTLRQFMKSTDRLTSVRAAAGVLMAALR